MRLTKGFELLARSREGVVRLRELILSLAIQGKLAPQDKDDEPANRLLEKISAEKNRLITEGKIKQDKYLPAIAENDKPFDLPGRWEWVRTQDICTVITDGDHQPPPKASEGVPFLVIGDVRWGSLDVASASRFVPEAYFDHLDWSKKPLAGDVLYTTVGSFGIPVQVTEEKRFCFQRHIGLFRPAQTTLQPFLNLVLASDLVFQQASARATGIAQKTVPLSSLRDFKIPLPPLAEQARIIAKVDELMALCDELENHGRLEAEQHARLTSTLFDALAASESSHVLAENWSRVAAHFDLLLDRPGAVDAFEQTVLQLAVRGLLVSQDPNDEPASELLEKIRAEKDRLIADGKVKRDKPLPMITDDDKPFASPVGWEWVRFDELNTPNKPISYGVLVPGPDVESGVPFVRLGDLSIASPSTKPEKTISAEVDAQYARTRLEGGEILMGVVGSIGKLGVAPESWKGANIARAICRIVPSRFVDKGFIVLLLQSEFMQTGFSGDTRTVAQPTLNIGLIRCALTPLPPLQEQRRIATGVDELRRLCADLRRRLTARQTCQAHFAEALIDQVASTAPVEENTDDFATAA
jgi:type I restriction enzyme S subunit